jgi:hypothetical protein
MDHWRQVLPASAFMEVQYEDVVADPEANARRIIDFLGLEWDPRCLKFHESDRPVKTQACRRSESRSTRPRSSAGRRYGDKLNPLIEALGLPIEEPAKAAPEPKAEARKPSRTQEVIWSPPRDGLMRRGSKIALLAVGGSALMLLAAAAAFLVGHA